MHAPDSSTCYRFFISLHARPEGLPVPPPADEGANESQSLPLSPTQLTRPLGVSFEEACEALSRLPRMFCEPDGSFVWRSAEGPPWQVDGVLYDAGPQLMYVELKGSCPAGEFDRLLSAFGHQRVPLVFQMLREGIVLGETAFRDRARDAWQREGGP